MTGNGDKPIWEEKEIKKFGKLSGREMEKLTWVIGEIVSRMKMDEKKSFWEPKEKRRKDYMEYIEKEIRGVEWGAREESEIIASDGSQNGEGDVMGIRTISTAIVTSQNKLIFNNLTTTLGTRHAELFGVAVSKALAAKRESKSIITDYYDAIIAPKKFLSAMEERKVTGRSLIKFIKEVECDAEIEHIKAHTGRRDKRSILNEKADEWAKVGTKITTANIRLPEYLLDEYQMRNERGDWVDSNPMKYIVQEMNKLKHRRLMGTHRRPQVEIISKSSNTRLSSYSLKDWSQKTTLLAKMSGLDTRSRRWRRGMTEDPWCSLCGEEIEDERHIFTECKKTMELRQETSNNIHQGIKNILQKEEINMEVQEKDWISDKRLWPDGWSRYYYGIVPDHKVTENQKAKIMINKAIASEYMKLTGRVWAKVKAIGWSRGKEKGKDRD